MDRSKNSGPPGLDGLPRTRGDGPDNTNTVKREQWASPHTRGWTCTRSGAQRHSGGFPAHAGMDPDERHRERENLRLPRTRGDGPGASLRARSLFMASPHTRGWTRIATTIRCAPSGFPAHAGMDPRPPVGRTFPAWLPRTRGDGPSRISRSRAATAASPHTRGWTRAAPRRRARRWGFPAHAGMDRTTSKPCATS